MHKISYLNTVSQWDEALPLGNGHFGAMLYHDQKRMICATNHYDVHYKKWHMYSASAANEKKKDPVPDTSRYEQVAEAARKAHADANDPGYVNYNAVMQPEMREFYGMDRRGSSNPVTGEIQFDFDPRMETAETTESSLWIEAGKHHFSASVTDAELRMDTVVCVKPDVIVTTISQSGKLVSDVELSMPAFPGFEMAVSYHQVDSHTVCMIGEFYSDGDKEAEKPFRFVNMMRVEDADHYTVQLEENSAAVAWEGKKATVLTCILTEMDLSGESNAPDALIAAASQVLADTFRRLDHVLAEHSAYWEHFFEKSQIHLPDKLLEKLWYFNLYALACCNGKGARLYEQACGLNGLWGVKQPTQWGSLWYWDVNIQQAFWPIYTSNHLELGEAFYDGLESYVQAARRHAKEYYDLDDAIASDYPFEIYNCIWAWCAQYFWNHYVYSNDARFLKERAYPLFKGILAFFEHVLQYDAQKDQYVLFPDISPEQGPVTRNSTISISCLKKLLKCAIITAEMVKEDPEKVARWKDILEKLPPYPLAHLEEFGTIIKDSEWSLDDQCDAHRSRLMPVYPIGEINAMSPESLREIAKNTVRFSGQSGTICTHVFGWDAAAYARLGYGADAVQHVYEQGIAYMLRPNGFFAEETDRWIQNCLVTCEPVYNPPMVEGGSALVAVVNELLLQSVEGVIHVFPAIPDGKVSYTQKNKFDFSFKRDRDPRYCWKECSFENLLAEGGFEVSAAMRDGKTCWIRIKSLGGNRAVVKNPFDNSKVLVSGKNGSLKLEAGADGLLTFDTEKGGVYELSAASARICVVGNPDSEEDTVAPLQYVAPTSRRVYVGKDRDTDYYRALDAITHDYYQGDIPCSHILVYKLDFTTQQAKSQKDYNQSVMMQIHACGKMGLDFRVVSPDTRYTPSASFGFENTDGLQYGQSNGLDPLREDWVGGFHDAVLKLHLVKGAYTLFYVAGEGTDVDTKITANGASCVDAGGDSCRYGTIPFEQADDGTAAICFGTSSGKMWRVCALLISRLL